MCNSKYQFFASGKYKIISHYSGARYLPVEEGMTITHYYDDIILPAGSSSVGGGAGGIGSSNISPSNSSDSTNVQPIKEMNSLQKYWKKEGRCPQCGELGPFVNLMPVCSTHGPYT